MICQGHFCENPYLIPLIETGSRSADWPMVPENECAATPYCPLRRSGEGSSQSAHLANANAWKIEVRAYSALLTHGNVTQFPH
jgi:hypothetical protein